MVTVKVVELLIAGVAAGIEFGEPDRSGDGQGRADGRDVVVRESRVRKGAVIRGL